MASYKRIIGSILILQLVSTSASRNNNKIAPDDIIQVRNGQGVNGRFEEAFIGRMCGDDYEALSRSVHLPAASPFGKVEREINFATRDNEIITMIRVDNIGNNRGWVEVTGYGPGFTNVTLKFTSRWNTGIDKHITLFGRRR